MFPRLGTAASRAFTRAAQQTRRKFGGHADMTKPFEAPHVARWHQVAGTSWTAIMTAWFLYRCKEDGAVVIGLRDPFEEHGDDDHGHAHHTCFGGDRGAVLDHGSAEECIAAIDALDRSGWSADDNGTLDVVYEQGHNQQGPTLVK